MATDEAYRTNFLEQQARDEAEALLPPAAIPSGKTNVVYTIPVVFHVVYANTTENIPDQRLLDQLEVLNEDFRKLNSDASLVPSIWQGIAADAEIEFCLASVDPQGNPTTGITRTSTTVSTFGTNDNMKFNSSGGKDIWDRNRYLNIWVCDLGTGLLGYAQFPGGSASTDGVVLNYRYTGTTGSQAPYNLGRTATHEVGHWLNLRHIWGDALCGSDLVSDTPTAEESNGGCPNHPHNVGGCSGNTSGEMFMNYMDYTEDDCLYMFTNGQKTRMRNLFNAGAARVALLSSNGCNAAQPTFCSGQQTLTGASGSFTDGSGASSDYANNADCSWLIQPAGGASSITLTFSSGFNLASGDEIRVYQGTNTSGTLLGTYTGATLPGPTLATGAAMFVRFTSNTSGTAAGFTANYTSVNAAPGNCSGQQTLTAPTGTVTDGSGANPYPNNANCSWLIQPTGATQVQFTFAFLDTESGYDYVRIYNGTSASAPLIGAYSGSTTPTAPITSTGGSMFIRFTSDGSVTDAGFSGTYVGLVLAPVCNGTQTLTAPSGTFTDGTGDYTNDASCKWLIEPQNATQITITFPQFALESGYDFVRVYSGSTESGTPQVSLTGTTLPNAVVVNNSAAFVVFESDGSVTDDGFVANYASVIAAGLATDPNTLQLVAFPNPTNGLLTLQGHVPGLAVVQVRVLDLLGRPILDVPSLNANGDFTTNVDLRSLAEGLYLVEVLTPEARQVLKVQRQ
jgi:hypothetical protein